MIYFWGMDGRGGGRFPLWDILRSVGALDIALELAAGCVFVHILSVVEVVTSHVCELTQVRRFN